jgi:hypothetical protein
MSSINRRVTTLSWPDRLPGWGFLRTRLVGIIHGRESRDCKFAHLPFPQVQQASFDYDGLVGMEREILCHILTHTLPGASGGSALQ